MFLENVAAGRRDDTHRADEHVVCSSVSIYLPDLIDSVASHHHPLSSAVLPPCTTTPPLLATALLLLGIALTVLLVQLAQGAAFELQVGVVDGDGVWE